MRAVVVQHEEHEDEGWFGPALVRCGFELVRRHRAVVPADAAADLLVVLGGSMCVHEPAAHPFLLDELAVLTERLRRGAPCLGICLGAQLMARAAGARGFRGAAGAEVGAAPVTWTPAALADPVLGTTSSSMVVAHWHQDTFTAVPGAELLASSARYEQQAFRLGASYGFQFHLELSGDAFAQWLDAEQHALVAAGHDVAAMRRAVSRLAAGDATRLGLVQRLAQYFAAAAREWRQGRG